MLCGQTIPLLRKWNGEFFPIWVKFIVSFSSVSTYVAGVVIASQGYLISDIEAQKEGKMRRKEGWEAWHPGMTTRRQWTSSDERQLRVLSVLSTWERCRRERQGPGLACLGTTIVSGKLFYLITGNTRRVQSKYSDCRNHFTFLPIISSGNLAPLWRTVSGIKYVS